MHNASLDDRNRILSASRWLLLLFICGVLVLFRSQITTLREDRLLPAFVVGVATNLVTTLVLNVASLRRAVSIVLLLADFTLAGILGVLGQGSFFATVLSGSALMIAGLLYPNLRWNLVHVIGVFTIMTAFWLAAPGAVPATALVALFLVGMMALLASYVYDLELGSLRRRVTELDGSQTAYQENARQRTRAITELTYIMSSTLNYKKVLDAVIEAGRLGLRMPERESSSLFAGVFLFHTDDSKLHVVSSRRLTRADEARIISGVEGIVGQALREAEPVFGTDARSDPELQYFIAFQGCKSLLCIPLRAGFDNFGALLYGSDSPNAFTQEHSELLSALGVQATLALQNAVLYHNLIEEKERIVDVDEEARKKLARDLHDGPTQTIAAIAMRLSYITKLYKKSPEQVPDEIKKVEELARQTTGEIRHMLFTLRPLVLESRGLSAALNQLAEKTYEMHKQAVAVRVEQGVEERLDSQQQGVIFDIVDEAINNARKHAKAKLISVTARRQNDMAVIQIADNGAGFDVDKMNENYERRSSFGMVNMRERAELLDGSVNVESMLGKGTTITLLLPLKSLSAVAAATGFGRPKTKLAIAAAARIERGEGRQPYL
ncbi:MAG: GAF domain-containing sensor histidine kinase [Chloroflexota bacterium]